MTKISFLFLLAIILKDKSEFISPEPKKYGEKKFLLQIYFALKSSKLSFFSFNTSLTLL
jgi:hypothetical protein